MGELSPQRSHGPCTAEVQALVAAGSTAHAGAASATLTATITVRILFMPCPWWSTGAEAAPPGCRLANDGGLPTGCTPARAAAWGGDTPSKSALLDGSARHGARLDP